MKKILFVGLVLLLLLTASFQPARADTFLSEGTSLWVSLQGGQGPNVDLDAMTLFWPLLGQLGDPLPETFGYRLYAPDNTWTGSQYYDPFNVDLSPFQGKDVIFEISVTGETGVNDFLRMGDDAYIWGESSVIDGWGPDSLADAPFYYAFYEYADTAGTRQAIGYLPGAISTIEPSHGQLFFELTITDDQILDYIHTHGLPDWNMFMFPSSFAQRSDFTEPVPEPLTILLLGSGLVSLAGFRKKIK